MKNHATVCLMSLLLGSCISVNLPARKTMPAKGVEYSTPGSPYKVIETNNSDKAWISESTSNTISFASDCSSTSASLQQLESESLIALANLNVLASEIVSYNGREAKETLATGTVDGIPVQLSLIVFNKNNCNYTLTYGGLQKNFASEEKYFDEFKTHFKAP